MAFLQGIRDYFAERELKKLGKDGRGRKLVNYHQAKSIGVLYDSTDESKYILVKHFIDYFKKEHGISDVIALGYLTDKEVPFYHSHVLTHDYFTIKELNWKGNPTVMAAESFIDRDLDILIDLSEGDIIPLRYVLQRSAARFKVGRIGDAEVYDLVVMTKAGSTLDSYIKQVNHYLSSINHHEERRRV